MRKSEARLILPSLREWETRVFDGIFLSQGDRAFDATMSGQSDSRLQLEELRRGLRVHASSWVGVVRLETVEIRVVPKVTGDNLGLVKLLEYASGLDALWRPGGPATLQSAGDSLLDLVALLFIEACERVLRRGLLSGYIEREEDLPMVRGRILAARQLLERFGQLDRIVCRFDELEHDVVENRLLAATLQIAFSRVTSPNLHRRIARLRAVFEPICDPDQLDLKTARFAISYDRLNAHYETAHQLAWLFLDSLGIDDLLAPGRTRSFAFLLNMNLLFERFVTRLVEQVLPARQYRVSSQSGFDSILWNVTAQRSYSRIIPDVVVERRDAPGRRVAIDAKYKLYDEKGFAPGDIYQTFLYAFAFGPPASGVLPVSLLLYPATSEDPGRVRLRVRPLHGGSGAEIIGIGLPVAALLGELTGASGGGPMCDELAAAIESPFGMATPVKAPPAVAASA